MFEAVRQVLLILWGYFAIVGGLIWVVSGCWTQPEFTVSIVRTADTAEEAALIALAEAHCPAPEEILAAFPNTTPPEAGACLWWHDNGEIRHAYAITADAISYYEDLLRQWEREGRRYRAWLEYEAHVEHDVPHPEGAEETVTAVHMDLDWGFGCGAWCGYGCRKTRTVFIDGNGAVVGVAGDGPGQCWVS